MKRKTQESKIMQHFPFWVVEKNHRDINKELKPRKFLETRNLSKKPMTRKATQSD